MVLLGEHETTELSWIEMWIKGWNQRKTYQSRSKKVMDVMTAIKFMVKKKHTAVEEIFFFSFSFLFSSWLSVVSFYEPSFDFKEKRKIDVSQFQVIFIFFHLKLSTAEAWKNFQCYHHRKYEFQLKFNVWNFFLIKIWKWQLFYKFQLLHLLFLYISCWDYKSI